MTLPLIFYPLTITMVDDDPLFLQAIHGLLKNTYTLKQFNNPLMALDYFKNYQAFLPSLKILRGCTELESYNVSGHLPVDLDFDTLKNLREKPERLNEIGVMIVDFNMPGMTGVELCHQLKSLPIKKILLTGEADDQIAIDAFNDRIIDCFIRKDSQSLAHDIQFYLNILTQQYFVNNTKQLLKHLETDNTLPASDPIFIHFFKEWCITHKIQEFYLIDQNANFLLIDEDKQKKYFITHTDKTLDDFIELHEEDNNVKTFIDAVKTRDKIPFFGEDKESWSVDTSLWEEYFCVPKILEGREKYYYTVQKSM